MVVLGIGNSLLSDEGVGIQAVTRLRSSPHARSASLLDGGTLGFTLLPLIERAAGLIVIDAAELGAPPGTVQAFEDDAIDCFLAGARQRTVHEVGLADLLAMARLQDRLPARRALISIQPQSLDWGESLSPAVRAALPQVCELTLGYLQRWRPCA